MSVRIGHSSIDENGKAHGGQAGDSTLKEVCTRSWYNGNWHTVLRPIDPEVAEKMASACEAGCANDKIGYDQWQRNTLRTQAKAVNWDLSKITVPCECDCSSFMSVCAECAGIDIPYYGGNAPTTSSMVSAFSSTGEFKVLQESKYLTSDAYLKRGDILVKKGHTVMVHEDGERANVKEVTIKVTVLRKKCKGEAVRALQCILTGLDYYTGELDGSFGNLTDKAVRKYQEDMKLEVDGVVGSATWEKLLN
jgi:hypothetical protein